MDLLLDASDNAYKKAITEVPELADLVKHHHPKISEQSKLLLMEFVLHGLAEYSLISKQGFTSKFSFKDILSGMMSASDEEDEDDWGGYYEDKK